ncbi:MAG: site-specific recombinase [Bacteroidia bacterium]|nr:site-specific recombinase [Bacteroidia bacterium]
MQQCLDQIKKIRNRKNEYGITLHITYTILRLEQNIDRIKKLLHLLAYDAEQNGLGKEVHFFKEMVSLECDQTNLRKYLEQNINLMAFQITEHASKKGAHYISNNRREYWRMLISAAIGGFMVGFLSVFKSVIYYWKISPFGKAFFYSMNYSFGFMGLYMAGGTLATKQPAMTASTIAQSLGDPGAKGKDIPGQFARLIARTSRTQLIAFFGNVALSFPVAFGVSWLIYLLNGEHLATPEKAHHLMHELHPWHSPALFHAGIAGVYLFLSGLIAGYYDNKIVSEKIPQRVAHHPVLNRIFSHRFCERLGHYIDNHGGALAGNFYLGIFLGSTGIVGEFLGLPIDIRHITFAAGNFGIALAGLNNHIPWPEVLVAWLGIVGIGGMNFAVSFSLAIFVATQSLKINQRLDKKTTNKKLLSYLGWYFIRHPGAFFLPPRKRNEDEEIKEKAENMAF